MPLQIGLWTINVNGNVGQLQINAIDASGNLSGSINVWGLGSIFGYWDEISQEISFSFVGGSGASPDTATFIGYLFTDNQTRMPGISGAVVYTLAGTFRASTGFGGSTRRHVFAWYAQIGVD